MIQKLLLGLSLLFFSGCASSALGPLVVDGRELHASLVTRELKDVAKLILVPVLRDNPSLSNRAEFVDVIVRMATQGRLNSGGVRAALYAVYLGESEVGVYALEAASPSDADRLEGSLREIWAYGESLGRVRVHRAGKVLVVVWHGGVSLSCWETVNAGVVERMAGP